jgi:hypothetical protein
MRDWSVLVLVLFASLGACGDSSAEEPLNCTLIGCNDGVHVVVRAARDAWPAGDYFVEVSAGKDSHTCTATLPNPSQSIFENTTLRCERNSSFGFFSRSQSCDGELDGGTDGDTCGTLELELPGTPPSVRVRIDRNGENILDKSLQPKYRESQPNGRGCAPICERSSTELTLSDASR